MNTDRFTHTLKVTALLALNAVFAFCVATVWASGHSSAPLIKQDPQANLTDLYAFIGKKYNDSNERVLNVLVSVRPFSDPGAGAIYERFADDALYSITITHPTTGKKSDRYTFLFSSVTKGLKNPDTILSYGLGSELGPITTIGDARQNYTQTFTVRKNGIIVATNLPVVPPNVGLRTTPGYNDSSTGRAISGAASVAELDSLTLQGIRNLPGGEAVWAGPRDDGFYADMPGLFDLFDPRIVKDRDGNPGTGGFGQDGGGTDGFQGFNVLCYAIQIPIGLLTPGSYTDPLLGTAATGVGVFAAVSRRQTTVLSSKAGPSSSGPWVQVDRLGNPLFNEFFVAMKDKDRFNRSSPIEDAQFAAYALSPEMARLMNLILFGDPSGTRPLSTTGRSDLESIFIPDVIRVDTTTPPVLLPGQPRLQPSRLLGI